MKEGDVGAREGKEEKEEAGYDQDEGRKDGKEEEREG